MHDNKKRYRKRLAKFNTHSWLTTLRELQSGELPQFDREYLQNHTADIILSDEKLKPFSLRSEVRQQCILSLLLFNMILEIVTNTITSEKT